MTILRSENAKKQARYRFNLMERIERIERLLTILLKHRGVHDVDHVLDEGDEGTLVES